MKANQTLLLILTALASGKIYAGGPIEPVMVTIPAGSFEMGSDANPASQPVHTVTLPEFSIGKYEVTVSEFRRFAEATNYKLPEECRSELNGWFRPTSKGNWENNGVNQSEYQPVVCINWNAADAYVKWLAKETGKPYRLPSEAEWEYAARAGTTTDYFFGDDPDRTQVCEYANTADLTGENILQRDSNTSYYNWSTGMVNCVDGSAYASIVGMYKPNQFGLHDVVSNVLEFLADCYVDGYDGAPTDGSARQQENCERRATRGGSWHWNNWPLAQRGRIPVDFAGGVDGFRIALDGKAPKQAKSTKRFAANLKFAQQQEQKRRDYMPEFPGKLENVKLKQDGNMVTLTWDKSAEDEIEGYRVYRNSVAGGMYKLLATNLTETQYIDVHESNMRYDYSVVAVRRHMQGPYSEAVTTQAGWAKLPGRIEAQWASSHSGTSLTRTSDENGDYNFTGPGGISDTATLEYQVEVPKSGEYQLQYRVATPRDTKGFEIHVNGKKLSTNPVAKTGGYHEWATQGGEKVHLKKGRNVLKINSLDNNWKLNWLSLKQ